MRTTLIETLVDLARVDERIMLLTADLGWNVVEPFLQAYPDRFVNVGVAEQNMLGIATGLALVGYVPYVYSIATFSSMRCYEQIRNGPVLHRLPVRIIGIGGGYAYGHAGPTHHALEDLALARTQPGLSVVVPADREQLRSVLLALRDLVGPAYLRVAKSSVPAVAGLHGRFAWETPELVRPGRDLLLLCTGEMAHPTLQAADMLFSEGLAPAVAVLAHLGFRPGRALTSLLSRFETVVAVEEAFVTGGLGSLAAETIAEGGLRSRLMRCGVAAGLAEHSGSTEYLRSRSGLTAAGLARRISEAFQRKRMAA
jgi:transketolase